MIERMKFKSTRQQEPLYIKYYKCSDLYIPFVLLYLKVKHENKCFKQSFSASRAACKVWLLRSKAFQVGLQNRFTRQVHYSKPAARRARRDRHGQGRPGGQRKKGGKSKVHCIGLHSEGFRLTSHKIPCKSIILLM